MSWRSDNGARLTKKSEKNHKERIVQSGREQMMQGIRNIILLSGPARQDVWRAGPPCQASCCQTLVLTVSCQQASEGNGVLCFSFAVESGSGSRWDPAVRTFVLTVSSKRTEQYCKSFDLGLEYMSDYISSHRRAHTDRSPRALKVCGGRSCSVCNDHSSKLRTRILLRLDVLQHTD